ncbi:MAG TPA: hypothetical protein VN040_21815 [Pseudosphingobacterium sp.]|nr:hypothetical protein [Pseudosphingobacterium sp.]
MNISVIPRPWRNVWIQAIKQWLAIQFKAKDTHRNVLGTFPMSSVQACSYSWNFGNNTLIIDNNVAGIFGFSDRELILQEPKKWLDRINPKDIPKLVRSIKKCAKRESSLFHLKITAFDKDNIPLCVTVHGEADYLSSTIRGSFLVLAPDFVY